MKRLRPTARVPAYQTGGAAGMDLHAAEARLIGPGETVLIPTGLAVEIPDGYEGQVRPRSSFSRRGIIGPTGTIDSDYRGDVGVILFNSTPAVVGVDAGERIAQLVVSPVARCNVLEVEDLSETQRGAGGFGSTGR
ncbi:MAG TPA: dUTP diphosphatase [Gemmatimonadaceae bacterium]|nr:dUTP diphosphatase [Gemmatimonadaceae bacterium]